jgi:beta-lactamase regulating signal transducer with metallopeptidase domain
MSLPIWFSNLLFWSAQVALLVVWAAFLPRLFQIHQPRVLLAYWRGLLVLGLILPFLQSWHQLPSMGAILFAGDNAGGNVFPAPNPAVTHGHFPSIQLLAQIAGVVILCGFATRLVLLVVALRRLERFRKLSWPLPSASESAGVLEAMRVRVGVRAEFRLSEQIESPVTFGVAAPMILLPERFPYMDARFQAAIACHELLHVRRRDWVHHLAEEIVRAALWFHPAMSWLVARLRLAREQVVDFEVVQLTAARKTYLEALLKFVSSPVRAEAISAPPFLRESQFAERVELMLKEVSMSRTRLIGSMTAIASCLALAATLAVRAFPLKAAPSARVAPDAGVAGGVSGGVSGRIAAKGPTKAVDGGIVGGVSGGPADIPDVDRSTIWIDTVKKGTMLRQVRGLGVLAHAEGSANLFARIVLPEAMTVDVRPGQAAVVDTRKGLVKGHVSRVSATPSSGTRSVEIALDNAVPAGAGAGAGIDGMIDIEELENVVNVGRPVHVGPASATSVFRITAGGTEAKRVSVTFGRASVQTIEVLEGLNVGDRIILSDMSNWDKFDRIRLK